MPAVLPASTSSETCDATGRLHNAPTSGRKLKKMNDFKYRIYSSSTVLTTTYYVTKMKSTGAFTARRSNAHKKVLRLSDGDYGLAIDVL